MTTISIIGSGNVGRRIGNYFSKFLNVIFYDIDEKVIKRLNSQGHVCSMDISYAIKNSDVSFVTVPTPIGENGLYDVSYLECASKNLGNALNKNSHIFIIKSTVLPGTTENIIIPTIEKYSNKIEGKDFGVVFNPEFLTVISDTWTKDKEFCINSNNEGRIILGEGVDKRAGDIVEKLYRKIDKDTPILRTNYKTAEFCKLVANNRLALAVSFSNEIFIFCEELREKGIDIDNKFVMDSIVRDPRIGKYGSVYGKGYGGPCLLKDTVVLRNYLINKTDNYPRLISGSIDVNDEIKAKYGLRE